jgi:diketogulonate reductase-like aldo/keto reductase
MARAYRIFAPCGRFGRHGSIQSGLVPLPKSTTPARIVENATVFALELAPLQMASLDALEQGLATGWDPRQQA